ncbi:MAG TPA: VIT1/CCC1 transporter family protein [bacterium]|nr:VIT1/CCC1 transporter family protein [bacterium]
MPAHPHHSHPHPHHAHHEKHSGLGLALRDVVVGVSDGLTVPFALAAGLSGAVHSNTIIITAGMAEIVAGTISMGLGGFLAGQTDVEYYAGEKKREEREVKEIPLEEEREVKEILEAYGISPKLQGEVAAELARDHSKWVEFMMRFELGLEKPDPRQGLFSALRIGLSYAVGGMVPLSAYFFCPDPIQGLKISSVMTTASLLLFGFWKAHLSGQDRLKSTLTVAATGILAAGAAYALARLINS